MLNSSKDKVNKKIKICITSIYAHDFFCSEKSSNNRVGGAELQLYNLAVKLAEDDRFEIHFFVGNFSSPKIETIKNIKIYKIFNINKIKIIFNFIKLWFILKKINFDICIQRSAGIETGLMALYCRINRKKFVYMIANDQDVFIDRPKYLGPGFLQKIRWSLFKMGLKRANLVLSQSLYQQENLLNNYNKKSVLRNNAHFLGEFVNNFSQKNNILWVGRADRDLKRPELFLNLAEKLSNYNFVMICQASSNFEYFNEIKIRAINILNLKFIEYVPFREIEKYYQEASILVNTSISEGFPNTFIEAFKSGSVVFSLNINPNNILDDIIGFCFKGDFNEMVNKIEYFMDNKEVLINISKEAFEYVKNNHSIEKIAESDKRYLFQLLS